MFLGGEWGAAQRNRLPSDGSEGVVGPSDRSRGSGDHLDRTGCHVQATLDPSRLKHQQKRGPAVLVLHLAVCARGQTCTAPVSAAQSRHALRMCSVASLCSLATYMLFVGGCNDRSHPNFLRCLEQLIHHLLFYLLFQIYLYAQCNLLYKIVFYTTIYAICCRPSITVFRKCFGTSSLHENQLSFIDSS